MAQTQDQDRTLLGILLVLTLFSGFIDAVSYLGLGHVFTANMTGNVVILGFAAAGASGFSAPACLTSLGAFLLGAVAAGRVAALLESKRRRLVLGISIEGVSAGAAAAVAMPVATISSGWPRFTVIAVLAFGMGWRNATVRSLGVRDMPTTVLTMTLTGLAADSSLAAGHNALVGRRVGAVGAMLVGALIGAVGYLHIGAGPTLVADAAGVLATGVVLATASRGLGELDPNPLRDVGVVVGQGYRAEPG